jgi:peptidoglycan L-alanyl-D-glutamate endopeptidase CwlK
MPKFGSTSRERLKTCDQRLQNVANEVIKHIDCSVICGHRNEEDQNAAVAKGNSKATYPNGRHNAYPSLALDIAPYDPTVKGGIPWDDYERLTLFAGFFLGIAKMMYPDVKIIWGNDWDGDFETKDTGFKDYPHFEIRT